MDKWEDYTIKVLIMAPLIMVSLPTVPSFFSTRGCFLRGGWSPSGDPPPLSSLWMAFWCEWLSPLSNGGAQAFRVQDPSGARKTGLNRPPKWAGPAGLGPPRPGSVTPFAPWVLMHLCTLPPPLAWFWWCHPRVQDGGSLRMKFGFLRFNPRECSS
jgi:hypothetical protein